jgi:hypothetical protein
MAQVSTPYTPTDRYPDPAPTPTTSYTTINEVDRVNMLAVTDRVRWAAILAGLFTVFAAIAVLTILGVAIGLSTFDANNPETFGIGAGIYGAVSALVAFALGGFVAARSSGAAGAGNSILNSGMVWIVAIVLIVNFLGSGIGTLLGIVPDVAAAVAPVVAQADILPEQITNLIPTVQPDPNATAEIAAPNTTGADQPVVPTAVVPAVEVTPAEVEATARDVSSVAWSTLLALGLSAGAAIGGGMLGTRKHLYTVNSVRRDAR